MLWSPWLLIARLRQESRVRRGWLGMLAGVCEMGRRVVTAVIFVVSSRGSDWYVVLVVCCGRRKSGRQREHER